MQIMLSSEVKFKIYDINSESLKIITSLAAHGLIQKDHVHFHPPPRGGYHTLLLKFRILCRINLLRQLEHMFSKQPNEKQKQQIVDTRGEFWL